MGDIIKIRGLNRHGKNRVHEHGEMWEVTEWKSDLRPGLQFIRSLKTGDERWFDPDNFELVLPSRF
jgi:hypothetical protein